MKKTIHTTLVAMALTLSAVTSTHVQAADYPGDQPVRLIVGAPPGGGGDTVARIVAEAFAKQLNGKVVVENRAGAGGNIGATLVARAAPDGHTIYFAYPSFVINPALMPSMPYDTKKDFRSLGKVADNQSVLLVRPDFPANDFKGFREELLANPDKYSFAGLQGSSQYVAGLLLNSKMGAKTLNVPYKGNSNALNDLIGGQVDMMFNTVGVSLPFIESGKVKAIALAGGNRTSVLPDVPTIKESGMPDFTAEGWYAFQVPAKTPDAIVDQASKALEAALKDPEVAKKLAALGTEVDYRSPKEFDAFVDTELDRWVQVAKDARIDTADRAAK